MKINVGFVCHLLLVVLLLLLLLLLYVFELNADIPEDLTIKGSHTHIHSHTGSHICATVVIDLCWRCSVTFTIVTVIKVYQIPLVI